MGVPRYTDLRAAPNAVPDPRCRRGRRYAWPLLLTLIAAALASGERNVRAIGQWVGEHADELRATLAPSGGRLPSTATLRRVLRAVDVVALEQQLAAFSGGLPAPACPAPPAARAAPWVGQAVDGKAVRGANRHGALVHLVGLVRHADARVLGQVAVAAKSNDITTVPPLLGGRDLSGTVTTMDAMLAQRALAGQIRAQGGHYLMFAKGNQPDLAAAITRVFAEPPPPRRPTMRRR